MLSLTLSLVSRWNKLLKRDSCRENRAALWLITSFRWETKLRSEHSEPKVRVELFSQQYSEQIVKGIEWYMTLKKSFYLIAQLHECPCLGSWLEKFCKLKELLLVSTIVWSSIHVIYETNKIIKMECNFWLLPVVFIAKYQKWVGRISKRVFVISGRDTVMKRTHLRLLLYLNQPLSSHHRAKGLYSSQKKIIFF